MIRLMQAKLSKVLSFALQGHGRLIAASIGQCLNSQMLGDQERYWNIGVALGSLLLLCAEPMQARALPPSGQAISFPGKEVIRSETKITDHSTGITYEARLTADRDVEGRPVVVDMILRQAGSRRDERNLVEPAGNWHGLQPFSMAATDVINGASSVFGLHRRIPIQGSHATLLMDIKDVQMVDCSSIAGCAFSSVTVVVTLLP